jgi:septal ring factor EnvC (AmiA/AmiB activator)
MSVEAGIALGLKPGATGNNKARLRGLLRIPLLRIYPASPAIHPASTATPGAPQPICHSERATSEESTRPASWPAGRRKSRLADSASCLPPTTVGTAGRTARFAFLALALTLGGLAAAPASAQRTPAQELAESQHRLEEIRQQRAQLRDELDRIRGQVHDVSAEMANLRRQVSASAQLLAELSFQVQEKSREAEETTRELLATQDQLAERRALLQRRLRDIYKRGPLPDVQVLLGARSFADLLNRYKYLYLVARRDQALVHEVDQLRDQLVLRDQELKRALSDIQYLQQEREQEHTQLQALAAQQGQTLTSLQVREQTTMRRAEELALDEQRMSSLIGTLERRRREAERLAAANAAAGARTPERPGAAPSHPPAVAASPTSPTLTAADAGTLGWPVGGRIVYRFGRAAQPNGTIIRWNGIGIGAAAGSPVRAVEAGTVVLAAPFEAYGPTVVVSHGGGYYSLYLYLRDVSVREGQSVTRGQTVGTVGGEGTPEGAHIEFQIRTPGGQAVDPLGWLRSGR